MHVVEDDDEGVESAARRRSGPAHRLAEPELCGLRVERRRRCEVGHELLDGRDHLRQVGGRVHERIGDGGVVEPIEQIADDLHPWPEGRGAATFIAVPPDDDRDRARRPRSRSPRQGASCRRLARRRRARLRPRPDVAEARSARSVLSSSARPTRGRRPEHRWWAWSGRRRSVVRSGGCGRWPERSRTGSWLRMAISRARSSGAGLDAELFTEGPSGPAGRPAARPPVGRTGTRR